METIHERRNGRMFNHASHNARRISKYRDWGVIMYDMMQDGMSKYEAMAAMAVMDCPNSIMTRLLEMKNAKS